MTAEASVTLPADVTARRANRWRGPLLLLLPMVIFLTYIYFVPLLGFFRYAFYQFIDGRLEEAFVFDTIEAFATDPYYLQVILDTLKLAALVTVITLCIAYPLAYFMWRVARPRLEKWLAVIVFAPILVSVVVRSYGWTVLLAPRGPVNYVLMSLGVIDTPIRLVYNLTGVLISLTHVFLPLAVFPILASLRRIDPALREAASDLGAAPWRTFRRVTFPLSLPGVVAGAQICFTLSLGAFVTPSVLGGGRVQVLPTQIYTATVDINWPLAAVGSFVLLIFAMLVSVVFNRLAATSEARA